MAISRFVSGALGVLVDASGGVGETPSAEGPDKRRDDMPARYPRVEIGVNLDANADWRTGLP